MVLFDSIHLHDVDKAQALYPVGVCEKIEMSSKVRNITGMENEES